MRSSFQLLALSAVLLLGMGPLAHARSGAADALREVSAALAAMGGKGVVTSVHALRLEAVGHRNMLESWPHIGGLREYVARRIPIYAVDLDRPVLTRLFDSPHTFIPDDLQRHRRAPRWHLVAIRTSLGDGANRLELVPYRTETGERQMMVYLPRYKLVYSSDLFAPDEKDTWFTPEYLLELRNAVSREHLDVDTVFGMHYDPTPYKTAMRALDTFLNPHPPVAATDARRPSTARP